MISQDVHVLYAVSDMTSMVIDAAHAQGVSCNIIIISCGIIHHWFAVWPNLTRIPLQFKPILQYTSDILHQLVLHRLESYTQTYTHLTITKNINGSNVRRTTTRRESQIFMYKMPRQHRHYTLYYTTTYYTTTLCNPEDAQKYTRECNIFCASYQIDS